MNKFKILILTYYWPPSGGSAVLRWLKFAKYLKALGHEPIIYTPSNPEAQEIDESLLKEIPDNIQVIQKPIWEPYAFYKLLLGKKKSDKLPAAFISKTKKPSLASKLAVWVRSNLFIPDPRKFWIKPSVKFLTKYIQENNIDIVISTGPPHSLHLIAKKLQKKTGVKWLADFRDPWTNIDFYSELTLTRWADQKHHLLEQQVLKSADAVVTVSPNMSKEFEEMGAKKVITITNGYDIDPKEEKTSYDTNDSFEILHLGSIPKTRNSEAFWKAIKELTNEHETFKQKVKINLIGRIDHSVKVSIEKYELENHVEFVDFIPHEQTFNQLCSSSLLLLLINDAPNAKGILTNKFFEYLSSKRPILALGPQDGDIANIIHQTKAGRVCKFHDKDEIKAIVIEYFQLFLEGKDIVSSEGIEKYSRKILTDELVSTIEHILNS